MRRRIITWLLAGAAVLVLVGGSAAVLAHLGAGRRAAPAAASQQTTSSQPPVYQGTDLSQQPAPPFSLTDQSGAAVSLADLRGHPIFLTFFDSVCPHSDCSLMAQYMNFTAHDLGSAAANVNWVAISVDPWHDTPATATAFLTSHQVTVPIHYLLGTPEQLPAI